MDKRVHFDGVLGAALDSIMGYLMGEFNFCRLFYFPPPPPKEDPESDEQLTKEQREAKAKLAEEKLAAQKPSAADIACNTNLKSVNW